MMELIQVECKCEGCEGSITAVGDDFYVCSKCGALYKIE